jgi:hypothetical protein
MPLSKETTGTLYPVWVRNVWDPNSGRVKQGGDPSERLESHWQPNHDIGEIYGTTDSACNHKTATGPPSVSRRSTPEQETSCSTPNAMPLFVHYTVVKRQPLDLWEYSLARRAFGAQFGEHVSACQQDGIRRPHSHPTECCSACSCLAGPPWLITGGFLRHCVPAGMRGDVRKYLVSGQVAAWLPLASPMAS